MSSLEPRHGYLFGGERLPHKPQKNVRWHLYNRDRRMARSWVSEAAGLLVVESMNAAAESSGKGRPYNLRPMMKLGVSP